MPPDPSDAEKPRPKWWNPALTLGHLESRLHSAKLLDSPTEYKQALLLYAKNIADEGFRGKAEELIRELFGPVYWSVKILYIGFEKAADSSHSRPGRGDGWCPAVLGFSKRELLRDVLNIFGQFPHSSSGVISDMDLGVSSEQDLN
jgi:protein HIRA/HIR1